MPNEALVAADEYDLSKYTRPEVRNEPDEADHPWGKTSKKNLLALRVYGEAGSVGFPYHCYAGHVERPDGFTVYFSRALLHGIDAAWRVEVKGRKLGKAIDFLCHGWLEKLRVGGTADGELPFIESITWEAFEPTDVE